VEGLSVTPNAGVVVVEFQDGRYTAPRLIVEEEPTGPPAGS